MDALPTIPVDPARKWWVIKNDRGAVCKTKTRADGTTHRGCGKVHEYMSHDCRPVAFSDPSSWEFFRKEVTEDRARTYKERTVNFYTSRIGEVVEISEAEAISMGCILDPPAVRKAVIEVPRRAVSLPMGPVRVRGN